MDDKSMLRAYGSIYIMDTEHTSTTDFVSAVNGHQLVYELATPQTYHLTPQEVDTLLGINNVWADTGNTTAEYVADTKKYIDKKIAELTAQIVNS